MSSSESPSTQPETIGVDFSAGEELTVLSFRSNTERAVRIEIVFHPDDEELMDQLVLQLPEMLAAAKAPQPDGALSDLEADRG